MNKETRQLLAKAYRVPPHMIGDADADAVVPDVAGEILGWKALTVVGHFGRDNNRMLLTSPSYDFKWPPTGFATASCRSNGQRALENSIFFGEDHAPAESCTCGIYAVETPEQCCSYMKSRSVLAQVALSGKVIPGDRGWRAQHARIHALTQHAADLTPAELEQLADIYKVEILDDVSMPFLETDVHVAIESSDGTREILVRRARLIGTTIQFIDPIGHVKGGDKISFSADFGGGHEVAFGTQVPTAASIRGIA